MNFARNFKPEIKLLLTVASIAVVVSVGGILLLRGLLPSPLAQQTIGNQQSTIDTSTWQTYRNDKYEFEFQYPETFVKQPCDYVQNGIISVISPSGLCFAVDAVYPESPLYSAYQVPSEAPKLDIDAAELGVRYKVLDSEGYEFFYLYYPAHSEYSLRITVRMVLGNNQDQLNLLNQILPTFHFFGSFDKIVPWQIYTNTKYGYTVKFPSFWSVHREDDVATRFGGSILDYVALNPGADIHDLSAIVDIMMRSASYAEEVLEDGQNSKRESIIVDGVQGTKMVVPYHLGERIIVLLPFGEHSISLATDAPYEEIFNQILATFRFVE